MQKLMDCLEGERPASAAGLTEEEAKAIRSVEMVTATPRLVALNATEEDISSPGAAVQSATTACAAAGLDYLTLCRYHGLKEFRLVFFLHLADLGFHIRAERQVI